MEAKAYLRYVRISPRKVQIVCDLIRGQKVDTAMAILMNTPKSASEPLVKLLKSAVANAENNFSLDHDKLYVSEVYATSGWTLGHEIGRQHVQRVFDGQIEAVAYENIMKGDGPEAAMERAVAEKE